MDRHADAPGWGPARDSPNRFQRWLIGAPAPMSSAFWGVGMGLLFGVLTLARSSSVLLAVVVAIATAALGGLLFQVLRAEHDGTREQRLDATIKYLPTWRRRT